MPFDEKLHEKALRELQQEDCDGHLDYQDGELLFDFNLYDIRIE